MDFKSQSLQHFFLYVMDLSPVITTVFFLIIFNEIKDYNLSRSLPKYLKFKEGV